MSEIVQAGEISIKRLAPPPISLLGKETSHAGPKRTLKLELSANRFADDASEAQHFNLPM